MKRYYTLINNYSLKELNANEEVFVEDLGYTPLLHLNDFCLDELFINNLKGINDEAAPLICVTGLETLYELLKGYFEVRPNVDALTNFSLVEFDVEDEDVIDVDFRQYQSLAAGKMVIPYEKYGKDVVDNLKAELSRVRQSSKHEAYAKVEEIYDKYIYPNLLDYKNYYDTISIVRSIKPNKIKSIKALNESLLANKAVKNKNELMLLEK